MDLKDKVALVTGGASGLGRAFCEELLKNEAKVLICDLDVEAGRLLASELSEKYGSRVRFRQCDVTDHIEFEEAFEYAMCMFLGVDIVINNAEIMNDNFWELEVDINLNGVIRGTLLAHKFLRGQNESVLVNIGSSVSWKPKLSTPIYTATKHAILGLTKACGDPFHYTNTNVRTFAYCPSPVKKHTPDQVYFMLPVFHKAKELDEDSIETENLEHVAKELIPLIKTAPSGSIWQVSGNMPAKEMPYGDI